MSPVLSVENLSVSFHQKKNHIKLVKDVSFTVEEGMCVGILGESGSGKSMTCKAIAGLLDKNFSVQGSVLFQGNDLLNAGKEKLRKIRGNEIGMVLQNPMNCFDPLYRIGNQMSETLAEHTSLNTREINQMCIDILIRMQIKNPEDVMSKYPHQLSGGMLQRVMIGLSTAMEPRLLIADEPTTALDSISQFEIVQDFLNIKNQAKTAMIFISHDLGVLSKVSDKIVVMHNGEAVEQGTLEFILEHTKNEYTRKLIQDRIAVTQRFNRILDGGRRKSCS